MPLKLGNTILNQGEYDKNISWWTDTIIGHIEHYFVTKTEKSELSACIRKKYSVCMLWSVQSARCGASLHGLHFGVTAKVLSLLSPPQKCIS